MEKNQRKQAEHILSVLERQTFADFYGAVEDGDTAPFTNYIEGADNAPTRDEILDKIVRVFRLDWNDGGM